APAPPGGSARTSRTRPRPRWTRARRRGGPGAPGPASPPPGPAGSRPRGRRRRSGARSRRSRGRPACCRRPGTRRERAPLPALPLPAVVLDPIAALRAVAVRLRERGADAPGVRRRDAVLPHEGVDDRLPAAILLGDQAADLSAAPLARPRLQEALVVLADAALRLPLLDGAVAGVLGGGEAPELLGVGPGLLRHLDLAGLGGRRTRAERRQPALQARPRLGRRRRRAGAGRRRVRGAGPLPAHVDDLAGGRVQLLLRKVDVH